MPHRKSVLVRVVLSLINGNQDWGFDFNELKIINIIWEFRTADELSSILQSD